MAAEQDRSKNYLIKKAVQNYLEDLYFAKRAETILAKKEPTKNLEEIAKKYALLNKANQIRRKKSQ